MSCVTLCSVCVCAGQLGVLGPVSSKVPEPEVSPPPHTRTHTHTHTHTHTQPVPEVAMDSDEEGEDLEERLQALRS